jgi:hypothetical protein
MIETKIIEERDIDVFNSKVRDALESGWTPSGQAITIDQHAADKGHFFGAKKGTYTFIQKFTRQR